MAAGLAACGEVCTSAASARSRKADVQQTEALRAPRSDDSFLFTLHSLLFVYLSAECGGKSPHDVPGEESLLAT